MSNQVMYTTDPMESMSGVPVQAPTVFSKLVQTYEGLYMIREVNAEIFNTLNGDVFIENNDSQIAPQTPGNIQDLLSEIRELRITVLSQVEEIKSVLYE